MSPIAGRFMTEPLRFDMFPSIMVLRALNRLCAVCEESAIPTDEKMKVGTFLGTFCMVFSRSAYAVYSTPPVPLMPDGLRGVNAESVMLYSLAEAERNEG